MRVGDLVRFSAKVITASAAAELVGILVAISQPKGLTKPIATVFWTSENKRLQHLVEQLEVINENR